MLNPDYIAPWLGITLALLLIGYMVVSYFRRKSRQEIVMEQAVLNYQFDAELLERRMNAQPIFDQMDFDDIVNDPSRPSLKHSNVTPIKKD